MGEDKTIQNQGVTDSFDPPHINDDGGHARALAINNEIKRQSTADGIEYSKLIKILKKAGLKEVATILGR